MLNKVFWAHTSARLLTLLAIDQIRAPGTNRVKAHAKLGFALGVDAHNARDRTLTNARRPHD
jgi:hypothetical protein